jgi:integrase
MPQQELTDRFCAKSKPAKGTIQTEYFDTIVKGLSLIAGANTRTWYLHYTRPGNGRRSRLKLGTYPEITLASARQKAREARGEVGQGTDPLREKRALAASQTVRDLVENYIAREASKNRSHAAIARRLRKNVSAAIGDLKLSVLHRRDLTRCIDTVKDRGAHVEANRVFEDLRAMIRWARGRGDLDENLVEGMSKPSETVVRDRVLSAAEIRAVWANLPDADMAESTRRILRLCLIVGQRVGEIAGLTRDELDLERRAWTIPRQRTKNATEHKVPLPDMAVTIIREQLEAIDALARRKNREPSSWVFPGPGGRAPITGHAVAKAVKRQRWDWTPHDLRRTMATHLEELGVSPFIIGHVLNHVSVTKASVTSRVYARYDYASEKRQALELWADRLRAIIAARGAHVMPMNARHG